MTFKRISSETVFTGRVFNVRKDLVELPNGQTTHLDIVEHNDAVTIIPVDENGQIWFVRQYRHAAGEELLELPAGVAEAGEDPALAAAREVREEIGMAAKDLRLLGEFYLAPGYTTEFMHVYLATGLSDDPLEMDADEFLSVEKLSAAQAYEMASTGGLRDAKTLAALLLARVHFGL